MDQERICLLALHFIPGIGDILLKQLVSYCGSATEVFRQSRQKLLRIPGIGEVTTDAIRNGKPLHLAEAEFSRAAKTDAQILFYSDAAYPHRLRHMEDAPVVLYMQGNTNLNAPRTIGLVGTRKATSYGKSCVEELVEGLVPHNVLIVSGLAYGIDIHAHKEALKHGLSTVAVLGSGLDVIYPSLHLDTAQRMINQGALVTENPFGTKPDAHNFPQRNRIIAGLCDAIVVVEAGETGGALITAELANSYNRDVFAVPGPLHSAYSAGCNKLIKTHKANLLTTVQDIAYIMNWTPEQLATASQLSLDLEDLNEEHRRVLSIMRDKKRSLSMDELGFLTGHPPGPLSSLLLELEFKNRVRSLPGKMYVAQPLR